MPCLKIALPTNLHPWMNLFALRLKGVEIKTIIIWVLRDSEHPTTVPYDKLFEQLARNLSALSCIMHTSLTLSPLARDRNHTGYLCVLRAPHITDTHTQTILLSFVRVSYAYFMHGHHTRSQYTRCR